jgi:hypothetical protein
MPLAKWREKEGKEVMKTPPEKLLLSSVVHTEIKI